MTPRSLTHILFFIAAIAVSLPAHTAERPNFLWIVCEDLSPYLGAYGCPEAQTPNLDQLAAKGIRYTHAYANAPVCAVARSTLLTGAYATTIGTHHMRSYVQLPPETPAYPRQLRAAGYFCANKSKVDNNSNLAHDNSLWNQSGKHAHWRNRKSDQPFFAAFHVGVTHEAQLKSKHIGSYAAKKQIPRTPRIDPAAIYLPPYHPDLPGIRNDWARLHDLVTLMDKQVGSWLRELEKHGVADDTIVFFFSDHGGMLSRSKRYLYDTGTQVPLIAYFPPKWQHLAPSTPGSPNDRLVSFVDLPKTVLSLAKAPIPEQMQGSIFAGPDTEPAPTFVPLYRDRMGDCYDFSRAVTDGRYLYIRNFQPHRPRGRECRYGFDVQTNWAAWEKHYEAGKCTPAQAQFFQPKPPEEFFDNHVDPWQVNNLADQTTRKPQIAAMEKTLDAWMIATRDVGIIPEAMFTDLIGADKPFKTLYDYAQSDQYPVAELLAIAKSASLGDPKRLPAYRDLLTHAHPVARFWGAYALFLVRANDAGTRQALADCMTNDAIAANRVMAAQALAHSGNPDAAYQSLRSIIDQTQSGYVFLLAVNALRYAHLDDRLTLDDWKTFHTKKIPKSPGIDLTGLSDAKRITKDAIAIWPNRRTVD